MHVADRPKVDQSSDSVCQIFFDQNCTSPWIPPHYFNKVLDYSYYPFRRVFQMIEADGQHRVWGYFRCYPDESAHVGCKRQHNSECDGPWQAKSYMMARSDRIELVFCAVLLYTIPITWAQLFRKVNGPNWCISSPTFTPEKNKCYASLHFGIKCFCGWLYSFF